MGIDRRRCASICTVVGVIASIGIACSERESRNTRRYQANPAETQRAQAANLSLSQWIDELKKAYVSRGIEGFEAARRSLADQASTVADGPDYDTAAMVLRLGETPITQKEESLTRKLRTLAQFIEAHPGKSGGESERLGDSLLSYAFGNSAIDDGSVPARIVALYEVIAGDASIGVPPERTGR